GDHSPTEDTWHMQLFNDWFFYFLFNVPNNILTMPKYQYASTTYPFVNTYWTFTHDSSTVQLPQVTTGLKLYFGKNNKLLLLPESGDKKITLKNEVANGLSMEAAINEEFTGSNFTSKFTKNTLYLESTPLATDLKWVGTHKINM